MNNIKPKSVFCYNHQGKGTAYLRALNGAGFQNIGILRAQVVLIDLDNAGRVNPIKGNLMHSRSRLFVYPHAARPGIAWDGLFETSPYTCAQFVAAEGHIEVMRAYGYSKPLHVAGWCYSPIKDFKPTQKPYRVLFAPIHPTKHGFLSKLDKGINGAAFIRLMKLVRNGEIELSVRYMRGIENNGLTVEKEVRYIEGGTDLNFQDAHNADLVVGHQTYAYACVALGIPTLFMAEDIPPRNGASEDTLKFVSSWEKYKDLLMFPLDILAENDTMNLIREAARTDEKIQDWRQRMIGNPFNPESVAQAVISYL